VKGNKTKKKTMTTREAEVKIELKVTTMATNGQ
jgi:hypothetical protein